MVLAQQAEIFTKRNCKYCVLAKQVLRDKNIYVYAEHIVESINDKNYLLKRVPNAKTVPQIFIDNVYIGGYNELIEYLNTL